MILANLTKAIREQNYYAVVLEFLIVIAGVVIGFQITGWSQERDLRASETIFIEQIKTSIEADLSMVNEQLDRLISAETSLSDLLVHVETRQAYDPSVNEAFGLMYGSGYINLDRGAYESLKSEGVALIQNLELRSQILTLYERTYQGIDKAMEGELDVVLYMRPFFLENFRDLTFSVSATPIDYDDLIADVQLPNLIDYRLQTIRFIQIPVLASASDEMRTVLDELAAELEVATP